MSVESVTVTTDTRTDLGGDLLKVREYRRAKERGASAPLLKAMRRMMDARQWQLMTLSEKLGVTITGLVIEQKNFTPVPLATCRQDAHAPIGQAKPTRNKRRKAA